MDGLPGNLVGVGVKVMVCGNSCARKNGRTKRQDLICLEQAEFFFAVLEREKAISHMFVR